MQPIEHDLPGSEIEGETADELRRENQELRRQLQHLTDASQGSPHSGPPTKLWNPSRLTIWSIALLVVAAFVLAFFAGYIRSGNETPSTSARHFNKKRLSRA